MRDGKELQDKQLQVFQYVEGSLKNDFQMNAYGAAAWAKFAVAKWTHYTRADKNEHATDICTRETVTRFALMAGVGCLPDERIVGGAQPSLTRKFKAGAVL